MQSMMKKGITNMGSRVSYGTWKIYAMLLLVSEKSKGLLKSRGYYGSGLVN